MRGGQKNQTRSAKWHNSFEKYGLLQSFVKTVNKQFAVLQDSAVSFVDVRLVFFFPKGKEWYLLNRLFWGFLFCEKFEKPLVFLQLLDWFFWFVISFLVVFFYSYSLFSCLFLMFIKSVLCRLENESYLFCSLMKRMANSLRLSLWCPKWSAYLTCSAWC